MPIRICPGDREGIADIHHRRAGVNHLRLRQATEWAWIQAVESIAYAQQGRSLAEDLIRKGSSNVFDLETSLEGKKGATTSASKISHSIVVDPVCK
jgi:hypothetical protein